MTEIRPGQTWRNKYTGEMREVISVFTGSMGTYITLDDGSENTVNILHEYWELAEGGPLITLEYAFIDPKTAHARELTGAELQEAKGNWGVWKARYGDRRTEQGLAIDEFAKKELRKIDREIRRRLKARQG
jgi:hypothetical protein